MNECINVSQISTIISIGLAIAAIISPIAVALLNNRHQTKLKKLELNHAKAIKALELEHHLAEKQLDITFQNKKEAFHNLLDLSVEHYLKPDDTDLVLKLYSSAYKAASLCTREDCQNSILCFVSDISGKIYTKSPDEDLASFFMKLNDLTYAFLIELTGKSKATNT